MIQIEGGRFAKWLHRWATEMPDAVAKDAALIEQHRDRLVELAAILGRALQTGEKDKANEAWRALPDDLRTLISAEMYGLEIKGIPEHERRKLIEGSWDLAEEEDGNH